MTDSSIQQKLTRYRQGTFADLILRNALLFPEREAFVYGSERITFSGFNRRVNRLIHALCASGMKKGEVIATLSWNRLEVMDAIGAAMKGGFLAAPVNARLTVDEVKRIIDDSKASVLLFGPQLRPLVAELAGKLESVRTLVSLGGPCENAIDYDGWVAAFPDTEPEIFVEEDDPFFIVYTSGTTGEPKGAVYAHRQRMEDMRARALRFEARQSDRNLLILPLFHIAATVLWPFFYVGATTIISQQISFSADETLKMIQEERATFLHIVPTHLDSLLNLDLSKYDLGSLTGILYAASPMPVEMLRKGIAAFGPIFMQAYGQSESGPDICFLSKADHDVLSKSPEEQNVLNSCGTPGAGVHVRICDPDGADLPDGQVGEILVKNKALMQGYWGKPEETMAALADGWLRTGDMGYSDPKGYVFIVDRKKDMVITGGENVFPREVEDVLRLHPGVKEAAVFGVPDPRWIEKVCASVVLTGTEPVTADELAAFCKKRLAGYKVPKSIEFIDALPLNANGKVQKRVLAARFQ